jgi:hypothetical protein
MRIPSKSMMRFPFALFFENWLRSVSVDFLRWKADVNPLSLSALHTNVNADRRQRGGKGDKAKHSDGEWIHCVLPVKRFEPVLSRNITNQHLSQPLASI